MEPAGRCEEWTARPVWEHLPGARGLRTLESVSVRSEIEGLFQQL